jgi:DNA-binding CsgD family transcriptional regulator
VNEISPLAPGGFAIAGLAELTASAAARPASKATLVIEAPFIGFPVDVGRLETLLAPGKSLILRVTLSQRCFFGRELESARIDEVLDAARERRSGALVLRGEAGIGKTALLDAAVDRASDMRVLRALGVESEVEIAFSGLHELLRPALPLLDTIPDAQADALRAALALGADEVGERLAVFGAALSLLAAAAEEQPVLCSIDDAHWLDDASAAALSFVARRLDRDGIAMLFGVRVPEIRTFAATGIPDLRLGGLDRHAANQLIAAQLPAGAASGIKERLVEISLGNPLALIELPRGLTQAELTGREPLAEPVRVATAVERAFLRRLDPLPASTRRALLVVAASDAADLRTIAGALEALDLDPAALSPAETAGLVTFASSVDFCHPLARSAIYGAIEDSERRAAHRALARAADRDRESDRRAWHLAAAADAPDEQIASALVDAAKSARRRGGVWAEAKALERAARLTPEPALRDHRLVEAGLAAHRAGRHERAEALLEEAVAGQLELREWAHAQERRAFIRFERGYYDDALALTIDEAKQLEPIDARAAATLLTNAATVVQHRLDIPRASLLAERAWQLAGDAARDDAELCHILSFQRVLAGRVSEGTELAWRCAELVEKEPEARVVLADAATTLLYMGECAAAGRLLERGIAANRAAGALGDLGYTVHNYAQAEWYGGDLRAAYAHALEAVEIVEALETAQGIDECTCRLATFEAMTGRANDSRRHAQCALESTIRLGDRWNEAKARSALGLLALVTGEAEAAVEQLAAVVTALERGGVGNPNQFRVHPDLVEAYVRVGRPRAAEPVVAAIERHAEATRVPWTVAASRRCRALITEDESEARAAFEDALRLDDGTSAFERARTDLCFGEHLRRHGLRREARARLGTALEVFEASGAVPWVERARAELRASGRTLRRRREAAQEQLTPQELQIARLVAEGRRNREVAATLFVSPKTVEFHLTRIYRKLEIHSRSELVRRIADDEGGRSQEASLIEAEGP